MKYIPREEILKKLQDFIDNPSDETADGIVSLLSSVSSDGVYCWLDAMRIPIHKCPPECPGINLPSHFRFICGLSRFYEIWEAKPAEAVVLMIQLLAFLKSSIESLG
jgi:hypothetical protein